MKKILFLFLSFTLFGQVNAQECSKKDHKDLKKLLKNVYKAGIKKDSLKLSGLIYPMEFDGVDVRADLIRYILKNDQTTRGDYAYSDNAMKLLIDVLYKKFTPVPDDLYAKLIKIAGYKTLKQMDPKDIFTFDYMHAHILIIRQQNKLQLVFWERLNNLLE